MTVAKLYQILYFLLLGHTWIPTSNQTNKQHEFEVDLSQVFLSFLAESYPGSRHQMYKTVRNKTTSYVEIRNHVSFKTTFKIKSKRKNNESSMFSSLGVKDVRPRDVVGSSFPHPSPSVSIPFSQGKNRPILVHILPFRILLPRLTRK